MLSNFMSCWLKNIKINNCDTIEHRTLYDYNYIIEEPRIKEYFLCSIEFVFYPKFFMNFVVLSILLK